MRRESSESRHNHSRDELCDVAKELYAQALRTGRLARAEADAAPCLTELVLLRPTPDDADWLYPVPPSVALNQLIHPIEQEIQTRRQHAIALADAFEPFMAMSPRESSTGSAITVLEGLGAINATLDQVISACTEELLTIQPGSGRRPDTLEQALRRMEPLLDRGVRMRTLYQHTARHHPATLAYVERVAPYGLELRTLEEIIDRLIIVDRKVAFVPARSDRQVALELRHEGLVQYLVGVFDQFWLHAVPWDEEVPSYTPSVDGIGGVQRSIAKLLVEGHVDEAIARRLGMNVRTCRAHIAKLAAALGSGSRAQLGYLIAQSGILEQDQDEPRDD
ncbi:helix-turn-helix transcriptional regulator [Streptomyces roseicoloratus]|uniref:Helix-turn-helix transcriptional regulator n=2 Tax=Streptomyces roseicoloratus TaxID=2508722 RepID=A0ABY9RVQ2_9ACTN|nr:helix-turn-helix transcriptional regulator [Streptomyces roseicoloratus]WMX46267.1 helix-turn-helix transcriptional regulator [Streptomyces roseicoloratus]